MKECMAGAFCKCGGHSTETKHFEIYTAGSMRFWGISAYCVNAEQGEKQSGFILVEVEPQMTYVL